MKILWIDTYIHHKNKIGFLLMCKSKGIDCTISTNADECAKPWDLVFIPSQYIPPNFFPNTKCIMYGPHNFVFVDGPWKKGASSFPSNCFYNLLSDWVIDVQNEMGGLALEAKALPFAVEVDKFKPIACEKEYDCFVYCKGRRDSDISLIKEYLNSKGLRFTILKYGSYKEEDYLNILQKSKFGIWIDAHESQGFALEEALSCNVPLLVWNCTSMLDEYSNGEIVYRSHIGHHSLKATSIPYWDSRCGLVFYKEEECKHMLDKMIETHSTFKPREYILETLSPEVCMDRLLDFVGLKTISTMG